MRTGTCFLLEASLRHAKLFQTFRDKFEERPIEISGKNMPHLFDINRLFTGACFFDETFFKKNLFCFYRDLRNNVKVVMETF